MLAAVRLFVAGCEENQVVFHRRFDVIILLSPPPQILIERLASRTSNTYGKSPGELAATRSAAGVGGCGS